MQWKRVVALGATLGLVASGCGGSKPLSRAEFVKRANAVCLREYKAQVAVLKASLATGAHRLAAGVAGARLEALQRRELQALEALRPPDELQATFARWRGMWRAGLGQHVPPVADMTAAQHAQLRATAMRREALKHSLGLTC